MIRASDTIATPYPLRVKAGRLSRSYYPGKVLHWFTLFMAAPMITFVYNITIFIFPYLLFRFKRTFGDLFRFRPLVHIPTIGFMVGACFSTIGSINVESSLSVLPNYLYWGFLVIFLSSQSANLDFRVIGKACYLGVVVYTVYYYVQDFLPDLPIFASATKNAYAFNMIGFVPMAVNYILHKKGKTQASLFLIALSFVQFIEGRRAGLVLVFIGGVLVIYAQRIRLKQFLSVIMIVATVTIFLSLQFFEDIVKTSNPRIHELIYSPEEIQKTDPSYMVRQAMLHKGLTIFEERPLFGVGLNNFTKYDGAVTFDFSGAARIQGKDITKTSAHNSYVSLLGEGGLLLLTPVVALEVILLLFFLTQYNRIPFETVPIFIGLMGIAIHSFLISALISVFAWFLIGLAAASIYREDQWEGRLRL